MLTLPDKNKLELDDLDALLFEIIAEWDAERSRQRRLTRWESVKSIAILMLSGFGVGFAWKFLVFISFILVFVVLFASGFVFLIGAGCFLSNRESVSRLQSVLTQMRGFNDVRILPYELEAYEWFEGRNKANTASITSLLLKLKPSDAPLMKPHLNKTVDFLTASRLRNMNHDRW